jgi:spore maturation protein CgeB
MKVVLFYHSALSDWNHGNAHFLRGMATELQRRGHVVRLYEPADAWSAANLVADHGAGALDETRRIYPALDVHRYADAGLDLDEALDGANLVIVHEWNSHALVRRIGEHRARHGRYALLFHDTHHRSVSDVAGMAAYDLFGYDGVLAFGDVIRERYLERGWAQRAWTFHEAADVSLFRPLPHVDRTGDLVWVGNWGDDERAAELREFLLEPVMELRLRARVYGVRYPPAALAALAAAGIEYRGWLPNYRVPEAFAAHRVTVHVPRRPYVETLPGIPTIRPFEAMACGIPLVSAPWTDVEGLFTAGEDYLVARNGREMAAHLRAVLHEPAVAAHLASHARVTILARHTCAHRVDELLAIVASLGAPADAMQGSAV